MTDALLIDQILQLSLKKKEEKQSKSELRTRQKFAINSSNFDVNDMRLYHLSNESSKCEWLLGHYQFLLFDDNL